MNHTMPKQIGDYNKNKMLSILRERGPTTRVELSRLIDLSPTAVTRNTSRMLENGIIRECGAEESSIGRKPTLIELCSEFCYVLGVDIVGGTLKVALADLMGTIVKYCEEPIHKENGVNAILEQLIALLRGVIAESEVPKEKIWVITVGTPGIFDPDTGKSQFTFFLEGWDDVDIRSRIFEALQIETIIENDVNLDVIGETWRGVDKEYDNILYVKLGQGFAARVVLQNKLIRGQHKMAGEIGYMLPGIPLEDELSAVNYENMLCNDAVSQRYLDMNGANKVSTISDLYALAGNGDVAAEKVIIDLLNRFAIAVLNSATVLDPQIIILGGDACCFGKNEINFLKQRMELHFPIEQNIVTSKLDKKACLYGAVKNGLDRVEDRITEIW